MTWSDFLRWTTAAAWGLAVGGFYFYGLWWTLRKAPSRTNPKLWLGISYAVRLTVALVGFWLVLQKDVVSFFFTLGAFFLMRVLLTRRLAGPNGPRPEFVPEENGD
jgi:F1F0 ATPase subunit 2